MRRDFDAELYENLSSQVDYLNDRLDDLQKLMDEMEDEDEAEEMYGEERDEIEVMIDHLEERISALGSFSDIA